MAGVETRRPGRAGPRVHMGCHDSRRRAQPLAEPCRLTLPIKQDDVVSYSDLLNAGRVDLDEPCIRLTMDGYGYGWYRLERKGQPIVP